MVFPKKILVALMVGLTSLSFANEMTPQKVFDQNFKMIKDNKGELLFIQKKFQLKKFKIGDFIQKISQAIHSEIEYQKNQYKKFIKDVVKGTLERSELIEETINSHLSNDINLVKTDKLLKIILFAGVFELMFKHNTPKKGIIHEYLLASEYFLEKIQIGYLNAILDKIGKVLRK